MATPVITPLPPAPTRADGASDFSTKADAMSAALPPMVIQQNAAFVWQAGIWAQTQVARDAAATSANSAAESADSAATQVELAVTARQGSEAARDEAEVFAQAAGAGIAPPPLPNRFLGTDSDANVAWFAAPRSFETGDILDSSRALAAPDWLKCDGSLYLQASYPALFAKIGPAVLPFSPGVAMTAPPSMAGQASGVSMTDDGLYYAVVTSASPFVFIFKRSGNGYVRLADPDVLPAGAAYSVSFSGDGNYLAVAHNSGTLISLYKRDGDSFVKLTLPAISGSSVSAVSLNFDGTYLYYYSDGSSFIYGIKRSGTAFSNLTGPAAPDRPNATGQSISCSSDGSRVAISSQNSSKKLHIYKITGDSISRIVDPALMPAGAGAYQSLAMSGDGNYIFMSTGGTGTLDTYKISGEAVSRVSSLASVTERLATNYDGSIAIASIQNQSSGPRVYERTGDTVSVRGNLPISSTLTYPSMAKNNAYAVAAASTTSAAVAAASYDLNTYFQVPTLTHPGTFANINRFIKT